MGYGAGSAHSILLWQPFPRRKAIPRTETGSGGFILATESAFRRRLSQRSAGWGALVPSPFSGPCAPCLALWRAVFTLILGSVMWRRACLCLLVSLACQSSANRWLWAWEGRPGSRSSVLGALAQLLSKMCSASYMGAACFSEKVQEEVILYLCQVPQAWRRVEAATTCSIS